MYSLRLSLYRFEASTLAGEEVLGSLSRLEGGPVHVSILLLSYEKGIVSL